MILDKVASGELEDASATIIDQMGRGSKERKMARPKLRLTEEIKQADQEEESGDGMKLLYCNSF